MKIEKRRRRLRAWLMLFVFVGSYLLTQVLAIATGLQKVKAAEGVAFTTIHAVDYFLYKSSDGSWYNMYKHDMRVLKTDGTLTNTVDADNGACIFTAPDASGGWDNANALWEKYQASYYLLNSQVKLIHKNEKSGDAYFFTLLFAPLSSFSFHLLPPPHSLSPRRKRSLCERLRPKFLGALYIFTFPYILHKL